MDPNSHQNQTYSSVAYDQATPKRISLNTLMTVLEILYTDRQTEKQRNMGDDKDLINDRSDQINYRQSEKGQS